MAKRKKQGKTTVLQWVIRILILVIFCVSLVIAANRLMDWNQLRAREEELEKQKQEQSNAGEGYEPLTRG